MEADLLFVRVYGSNSQYGETPRQTLADKPLIMKNFPKRDDKVLIYLGEPLECIFKANKLRFAQGFYAHQLRTDSKPEGLGIDEAIDNLINAKYDFPKATDYNWYVTIILKKKIDIPDEYIIDERVSRYLWVRPPYLNELRPNFEAYSSDHIDKLALFLSAKMEPQFFENIVINNLFLVKKGKESLGLPKYPDMSIDVNLILKPEDLNINDLEEDLKLIILDKSITGWLKDIFHLRLFAIQEKDELKKFIWNFTFLESLINKLFKISYQDITNQMFLQLDSGTKSLNFDEIIGCNIDGLEKMDLKGKFVIVSLKLFPDELDSKLKKFTEIKKIRNDLAHGRIRNPETLPNNDLELIVKEMLKDSLKVFSKK